MSVAIAATLSAVAALALRGVGEWSWVVPAAGGAVGLLVLPVRERQRADWSWLIVTAAGCLPFLVARSTASPRLSGGGLVIFAVIVAAVGEELLFRRAVYGLLERRSVVLAVVATSGLFALVHVPMYGWRFAALDLAAGFVFGWQRWATRTWTAPAVTHVVANVVQYL